MTDIEIFEREMASYGGRLDWQKVSGTLAGKAYTGIAEHARDLIASARTHFPTLPSIYFDFVYNGEPNAYAFKREGRYFIGMTTGALIMLQLIFCRILADKQLLQEIGDPNAEAENLPLLTSLVPDAQRMYEAGVIPQRPKTEPRWLYSCRLLNRLYPK